MGDYNTDAIERLLTGLDLRKVPIKGRVKAVAEKTGYSAGMVSKVLAGKVENIDRFVKVICREYGLDEGYVWGRGNDPLNLAAEWEDIAKLVSKLDPIEEEAIFELRHMPDAMRWRAVAMLKELRASAKGATTPPPVAAPHVEIE